MCLNDRNWKTDDLFNSMYSIARYWQNGYGGPYMGDWILNKVRKCFTPYLIYINRSGSATGTGEPLVTCVAKTHRVAPSRDECKIIKVVFEYRLHFNTSFPPMLSTQDILVIHVYLCKMALVRSTFYLSNIRLLQLHEGQNRYHRDTSLFCQQRNHCQVFLH